ncbi:MAG TPA: efflux RND transporter periplasmic adaptor subunit [Sedimentibacter sp.]|nr:efflux RND transporter periplasmic adaptor subunit [Sedimentibacter sp.]HOK49070.1 efflux RND transporter periplasmic adaptor subunit [Sedimentibacter sp.]HOW22295.1 efflux RND transporter periplasmic adaptor subunit [Sedimentibacter sp.]HRC80355.1 efflux RND transporter periplasmic adaptor subunit [Sedimentibacter sp.]
MKKFFTSKKAIVFVIVGALAAIIFWLATKGSKAPQVMANVSKLERKTLEHVISVKAPLEGIEKAEVTSPLNYKIIDIRVKEGDLVKKDDVLAVLDRVELEKEIEYEENQIELSKLEAEERIKALQIEYDKALASYRDMEKTYEQNKDLYENGVITEEAFKKTEKDLEDLKRSLDSYNAVNGKIQLSQADKKRIEIQEDQLKFKKEELEKVMIKSPIDGTVTRVNVNIGRYARDTENGQAMFVVENLEKLQMKASVSEFDVGKIKLNQEAEIYSDILGKGFAKGRVARISPTAEQKDANTMERVIPVLIDVTERPENLIAGVIATAKIRTEKKENVFAVPSGAIVQDGEEYKIYILNEDNTLKSIPVEIGLETDLESEIIGDLSEGMRYVINPDETFQEGMTVIPNENE